MSSTRALCACIVDLDNAIGKLVAYRSSVDIERQTDAELARLGAKQNQLIRLLSQRPLETMDDAAAVARLSIALGDDPVDDVERLVWHVARFVASSTST